MPLRLTVLSASGRRYELTLDGACGRALSDVLAAASLDLGEAAGCAGHAIGRDAVVGLPPLLDGAVVTLDRAPAGLTRAALSGGSGAPVRLAVVAGPDAGGWVPLRHGRHTVGRGSDNRLTVDDPGMSRRHAVLVVTTSAVTLQDEASTNGTMVEGRDLDDAGTLQPGQRIRLGRSLLEVRVGAGAPAPTRTPGDGTRLVQRTPLEVDRPTPVTVRAPQPPGIPTPPRTAWLPMLLPLPVALVMAVLWGPQLLAFALLGPLVGLSSTWSERRAGRARHREEVLEYERAVDRTTAEVSAATAQELRRLMECAPDPVTVLDRAVAPDRRLWEREPGHAGWLTVRIGTATVPAQVVLEQPDGTRTTPDVLDAPALLDLGAGLAVVGEGGDLGSAQRAVDAILGQLAVCCPPGSLRLWVVGYPAGPRPRWWDLLPHRAGADLADDGVLLELRGRVSSQPGRSAPLLGAGAGGGVAGAGAIGGGGVAGAGDVLLVGPGAVGHPGVAELLRGPGRGVTVLVAAPPDRVPTACGLVLRVAADGLGQLTGRGAPDLRDLCVDAVGPAWTERLARALAPLRPDGMTGAPEPPDTCLLVDLLPEDVTDPATLVRRWAAGHARARVVLGADSHGPVEVDLDRDGPHVLVGGTTGSGKSELLQTLVASLAATLSPHELSLVLVDYKGGAAFAGCAALPHTVGLVTDLDGALAERALTSLAAELRRRERLLADHGVASWAEYVAAGHDLAQPLPRLVLVIDEFRMLLDEQPAFLGGLVRLAALGRSLGLHLVIATQRPAGAVTPDIAANVRLRIALRVREAADSEQIIGGPEAAAISERHPGRAYASVDASSRRPFQTAQVTGWAAPERLRVRLDGREVTPDAADGPGASDLDRLATTARQAVTELGLSPQPPPWLPPLPDTLSVQHAPTRSRPPAQPAEGASRDTRSTDNGLPLGLVDEPSHQRQRWLTWPPHEAGALALVGGPGSGRTTGLRSLLAGLGAASVPSVAYVVDGGSGLASAAELPWVGAYVPAQDRERVGRLLERLGEHLRARRVAVAEGNRASVAQWREEEPDRAPCRLVLVIDGWEALVDQEDGGPLSPTAAVLELVRDAGPLDLHLVLSGGRTLLTGRVATMVATTVALGRLDPTDAALAGLPGAGRDPGAVPPGRGRLARTGTWVQLAHPGASPVASAQLEALRRARPGTGSQAPSPPFRVPALPLDLGLGALPVRDDAGLPCVAVDDDLHPRGMPGRARLVTGPPGSGRSTALATLARAAARSGAPTILVTDLRDPADVADGVIVVRPQDEAGVRRALAAAFDGPSSEVHLLVDDADLLAGQPLEAVVAGALAHAPGRLVLTLGAEVGRVAGSYRGLVVDVARQRCGLLLAPRGPLDGEVFGRRLRRAVDGRPGRGWLVEGSHASWVQVAR